MALTRTIDPLIFLQQRKVRRDRSIANFYFYKKICVALILASLLKNLQLGRQIYVFEIDLICSFFGMIVGYNVVFLISNEVLNMINHIFMLCR